MTNTGDKFAVLSTLRKYNKFINDIFYTKDAIGQTVTLKVKDTILSSLSSVTTSSSYNDLSDKLKLCSC